MNNTWKCALVIGGKVYAAWKRKMLHDVIGGHQAYIHRKKDLLMGHRIMHLAKTTRGSRDARASRESKINTYGTFEGRLSDFRGK